MSATPKEASKAEKKEEVKKPADAAAEKAEAKVAVEKEGKDAKVEGVKADTSAKVAEAAKVAEPEKAEKKDEGHGAEHGKDEKKDAHAAHAAKPRTGKVSYGLAKPVVAANDNKEKAGEDPHPGFLKRWFWSPDGFLRSFLRPVGATLKTLWTSAKTTATLGAGIAPIPWASKWVREHYKGADIVKIKPLPKAKPAAEAAPHAGTPIHPPAGAAAPVPGAHPPEGDHAKPHAAEEKQAA